MAAIIKQGIPIARLRCGLDITGPSLQSHRHPPIWTASRSFSQSNVRRQPTEEGQPKPAPRMYRYYIDVHGQLFLHDTTPKNLTSCIKHLPFLDFFYDRVQHFTPPYEPDEISQFVSEPPPPKLTESAPEDWHEHSECFKDEAEALQHAKASNYRWISKCQGEWNFLETAPFGTPIVYKELLVGTRKTGRQDRLVWGGDRKDKLLVDRMKVCSESGYLYHPSPYPRTLTWNKRVKAAQEVGEPPPPKPFGPYSLVSSSLVLDNFSQGLNLTPETFDQGKGGTIEWKGKKWEIGVLQPGDRVDN